MSQAEPALPIVAEVLEPGRWSGRASDKITLDYDGRHRRRIVLISDGGIGFLLDLARSRLLAGGSALKLSDGRLVEVVARPEPLLEVKAADPPALLRLAWHIGNRHLAAQVKADRILIRRDRVIERMLEGLGAGLRSVEAPFDPESGAYGEAHAGHDHQDPYEPPAARGPDR